MTVRSYFFLPSPPPPLLFSTHVIIGNITKNPIVQACSNYMQDFIPNFNPKNVLLYAMKNSYQKLVSFTRLAEQAKKFEWPKPSLPETDQQPAGLNDLTVDGGHGIRYALAFQALHALAFLPAPSPSTPSSRLRYLFSFCSPLPFPYKTKILTFFIVPFTQAPLVLVLTVLVLVFLVLQKQHILLPLPQLYWM